MSLIDEDAFRQELLASADPNNYDPSDYSDGAISASENLLFLFDNLPTIEVEPVRHPHWYDVGSLSCRCSECGCKANREYKCCPNCGAKMDEQVPPDHIRDVTNMT